MAPNERCEMKSRGALRSRRLCGSARIPVCDECDCVSTFCSLFRRCEMKLLRISVVALASVIGSLVGVTAADRGNFFLNNLYDRNFKAVYSPSVTSQRFDFYHDGRQPVWHPQPWLRERTARKSLGICEFRCSSPRWTHSRNRKPTAGRVVDGRDLAAPWLAMPAPTAIRCRVVEPYSTVQDSNAGNGINPDAGLIDDPGGTALEIPGCHRRAPGI